MRALKILAEWPPPLPDIRLVQSLAFRKVSMEWPPPVPAIVSFIGALTGSPTGLPQAVGFSGCGLLAEKVMVHGTPYLPIGFSLDSADEELPAGGGAVEVDAPIMS